MIFSIWNFLRASCFEFRISQTGFIKLTKRALATYLIFFIAFSSVTGLFLFNPWTTKTTEAAWFNDNWGYRKRVDVTVTSNSSDITNVDLYLTVDTTGITANLQTNCEDLRFTSTSGTLLPYYIQSCNDNSAANKIWVRADLVPKDTTTFTMYMYYGNPSARSDSNPTAFNLLNNLQLYWPMNESSWTNDCSTGSVTDISGNGFNGRSCPNTTGPTTPASAKFGNGANFDGTNDYVEYPDDATLDITASDSFTVAVWMRRTSVISSNENVMAKKNGDISDSSDGYAIASWSDGDLCGYVGDGTTLYEVCAGASTITQNTWYHVAFVFDKNSDSTSGIYINGVYDSDGTVNSAPSLIGDASSTNSLKISYTGSSAEFTGQQDDFRFYKRALTPEEIDQLYNTYGTINVTPSFASEEKGTTSVIYWKFDDAQGTTAQDSTVNNLDGTLSGGPTILSEDQCISGKCLRLNGSGGSEKFVYSNSTTMPGAISTYSVSIWFKTFTAGGRIIGYSTSQTGLSGSYDRQIYMTDSGRIYFDSNLATSQSPVGTSYADGKWHYLVGVSDGSNIYLYIDGALVDSDGNGTTENITGYWRVGYDELSGESDAPTNDYVVGDVDEVKIYNQALTAAQVRANYNSRGNPEGVSIQFGTNTENMPGALSNGLVGYWKMDESSWTSDCSTEEVLDYSGNANHGESCPNGAANDPVRGKFGNAGDFDGSGDYVSVDDSSSLQISAGGQLTMAGWIKTSDSSGDIMGKNINSGLGDKYVVYFNFGLLVVNIQEANTAAGVDNACAVSGFNDDTWHHFAVTYDSKTGVLNCYKDGSLSATVNSSNTGIDDIASSGVFELADEDYDGAIDEARVYKRVLSGAEISQLYNWAPGPVGYWKLDEKSGSTVYDSSTTGANGTVGSAVTIGQSGKYGSAASTANGAAADNYIQIASNGALNNLPQGAGLTVSAWVFNRQWGNASIVQKDVNYGNEGWGFYLGASGTVVGFSQDFSGGTMYAEANGGGSGRWVHYAATYSGSTDADTVSIYVNGVKATSLVTNDDGTGSIESDSSHQLTLFNSSDFLGASNSLMDEVKIYNYIRTPSQIIQDMNAGHPSPGSPAGSALGYWKFDQGADNLCNGGNNDVCNSGNQGNDLDGAKTNMAATWSSNGKFGKALDFDGTDDYVEIADHDAFNMVTTSSYTWSMWINPDDFEAWNTIWGSSSSSASHFNIYAHTVSGQTPVWNDITAGIQVGWNSTDSTNYLTAQTVDNVLSTGSWSHVVVTYDGSAALASRFKIYINGVDRTTTGTSGGTLGNITPTSTRIGGDEPIFTGENFDGKIDEVKYYNSPLSPSQVKSEYNRGSSQILGALSTSATGREANSAASEYCIPGDSSTCTGPTLKLDMERPYEAEIDTSGNNQSCANLANAPPTSGKIGSGARMQNDSDLDCGSGSNYISASAGTLEVWVKFTRPGVNGDVADTPESTEPIIGEYNAVYGIYRGISSGNDRIWFHNDDGTSDNISTTYSLNTWYHLAWVHSGGTLYGYKNGVLIGSVSSGDTSDLGANFRVGSSGFQGLYGVVDEVKTFNYARSAAQIAWDYNRGKPLAHWKMDECQGTSINDSAGNGYTGTLTIGGGGTNTAIGTCGTSGAWFDGVSGKRNGSMDFDGTDDLITVSGILGSPANLTLSAWVNLTSKDTNGAEVISIGDYVNLRADDSSAGCSQTGITGGFHRASNDWIALCSDTAIAGTGWHHLVFTIDDINNSHNLYIDGKLYDTSTEANSIVYSGQGSNTIIGRHGNGETTYDFNGQIDDVKVFNYPLTANQVKTLYSDGAIRFGPATGAP